METAVFWIVWGFISIWTIRAFYYSFSKKKLEALRKAAFGISLGVMALTFLPWLPEMLGGKTGLGLALEGNLLADLFILLLGFSILVFLTNEALLLKIAAVATIANTFVLFAIMNLLRPSTFVLTFYDFASIVAVLFLLVCDVVVLFLWQQLDLRERKKATKRKRRKK